MYSIYKDRDYMYSRAHGRSSSNWIQTTSRSGLAQCAFNPDRFNAHSVWTQPMRIECASNAHSMSSVDRPLDILIIIINFPYSTCIRSFFGSSILTSLFTLKCFFGLISKDERGFPLTQYITNGRISRGGYTFTHFKHYHRVLRLISYSMSV